MSDSLFERVLSSMSQHDILHIKEKVLPQCRWESYYRSYVKKYELQDKSEFKAFCGWLKKRKDSVKEPIHDKSYWYDADKNSYVVYLKSKKRPYVIPKDTWASIKDAYSNWDGSPSSVNEICRKFGMSRNTLQELLRQMGTTHDSSPWPNEVAAKADESFLTEELLRKKEERVLINAERREYAKVKKDAEKYRRLDLYAKSIQAHFTHGSEISIPAVNITKSKDPYIALISPTDFHWGKYATTMYGDGYNREIAEKRLFDCTEKVLNQLLRRGAPEKVILGIGGDGLHIDNQNSGTTRGTPQDVDGNPTELAHTYVDMCRRYISFVAQVCPVQVFVIPGNHDYYTSALLRAALIGWFHTEESIDVVEDLSPRQTFIYGKSLITFVHGDDGNVKDYASIIAGESPKMWGKSEQRFIFTGHLHTERELPQFGNITVYRMPSLAGTDDWHHRKGYKSRKAIIGYVLDKEDGVIATEIVPVKGKKNI